MPSQVVLFPTCLVLALAAGCSEPPRKTLDDLYEEERNLPAVFLTAETGKRVIAPGGSGVFVDEETGELCWPALACGNPSCPARTASGEPFLFIAPDQAIVIKADGSVGYDPNQKGDIDNYYGNCPECRKIRDLAGESDEDRQRYSNWVQPYVLPETARRREDFAAARQQREADLRERMQHSGN